MRQTQVLTEELSYDEITYVRRIEPVTGDYLSGPVSGLSSYGQPRTRDSGLEPIVEALWHWRPYIDLSIFASV